MSAKARIEKTPALRSPAELRRLIAGWRQAGETIALVPTMGALHAGHLALARCAQAEADRVIVSIFVNPAQFGPTEDFARYPRPEAADLAALSSIGVDAAWLPPVETIYPPGFATEVTVGGLGEVLCGASRPGHFNGVATVVTILLQSIRPDIAIFGRKDFQQLAIIRRLHADLRLPGKIIGHPIVREADGLAMSSRNRYLSAKERGLAPKLQQTLSASKEKLRRGEAWKTIKSSAENELRAAGFPTDYLELRDETDLMEKNETIENARLFVAAWLGKTRLIDNLTMSDSDG